MSTTYSNNNIVNENGEQFIPASQRPDGTWRKARRVKDGYVPQEEVPLYESKGKSFQNKKLEPVTLSSGKVAHRPIPGLFIIEDDNEKKNAKKKNKKKIEDVTSVMARLNVTEKKAQSQEEATDPAKKLKNLKKRLREIESLEEKLSKGLIAKPEPEQLAKIKRKNDLLMQIRELEKSI